MSYSLKRRMVQLLLIILIVYFTYFYLPEFASIDWLCPLWHFQALAGGNANFLFFGTAWRPPEINFLWIMAILVLSTLIFGRVFCGWICPFGFLLEMTGKISGFIKNIRKNDERVKSKAIAFSKFNSYLSNGKYLTLFLVFVLAYQWKEALFCYICPAGGLFKGAIGFFIPVSLIGLAVVFVGVVFWGMRIWCRYLCPLGGVFSLLALKQVFRIRKEGKCAGCGDCKRACPVDIDLENEFRYGKLLSSDCLMCFRCLEACSEKILKFP